MNETLSPQNCYVLGKLEEVRKALHWLERNGITVLVVTIRHPKPVIWVSEPSRCGVLFGDPALRPLAFLRRHGERVMTTHIEGCQVQWRLNAQKSVS